MNYLAISTKTLSRREIFRVVRLWRQTVFPSVITTVLYFAIFGFVLGSRVGEIDGVDYAGFVSPGLVMLALIVNSYSNTAFSVFIEKFHRSFEELLCSPMNDHQIIIGFVLGGMFRGMLCAAVVWLTTYFLVGYYLAHPLLFILASIIASLVFSLFGLVNGLMAKSFDDLNVMTTLLLSPLVMLGGVFYSVNMLSDFWQKVAWLNPLLYVGNLFRYCMVGTANISPQFVLLVLSSLIVILYVYTIWLMRSTTYVRQ
ncbi:MAG: ABC transporter permease [Pseudomonadota bacterium]|nr:ABC transporter permease [Pseudomonadota bacterium]